MNTMNSEFFEALAMLEKERGIPVSYLIEKISNAIAIAVKRDMGGSENAIVEIDPEKQRFYVAIRKNVVEEVTDPETEITLSDATKYSRVAHVGGVVEIPLETKQFGRIAAQSAKHVIRQGISEAEKGQLVQKYQDKKYEIISVPVLKIDEIKGNATVEIDKTEAILPKSEQVPGEVLQEGQRIMVYGKNPKLMISRTHPGLIKRLFELHTPEIKDGTIEIKAISREAGSRTKIAVYSKDENVDAVGACIGPKGTRVSSIVEELGGEKIDVIKYSDDPEELIAAALSPAVVSGLLREEMGFEGVVFTDDLTMGAISGTYGMGEACVLAVEAGCDALLVCHGADNLSAAREALLAAVADGRITEARLDESVTRILAVKMAYGLTNDPVDAPDLEALNTAISDFRMQLSS